MHRFVCPLSVCSERGLSGSDRGRAVIGCVCADCALCSEMQEVVFVRPPRCNGHRPAWVDWFLFNLFEETKEWANICVF